MVALAFVVWMGGCGEKAVLPVAETEAERSEAGKVMEAAHVFSPETSWIWDDTDDGDTWMCLRKTFVLSEAEAKEVRGYLAADSKYRLYVNGTPVIREGAIKRGMSPDSIYYDSVDLSDAFVAGENTIAVLAWYFGESGAFGYHTSKKAAFLMELDAGDHKLSTDGTWKVKRNPAFSHYDESNPRLPEYDINYHASLEEGWTEPGFDDGGWSDAVVKGKAGELPWGRLLERPVPMFWFGEETEFENGSDYTDYCSEERTTIRLFLPGRKNIQFVPCFTLEADAAEKEVLLKTDAWEDHNGNSVMLRYYTKEGLQEFESPAWQNGEEVILELDPGIRIKNAGFIPTGYFSEEGFAGSFVCSDPFYEKLWEKAQRTLYVNMRDSFMDCPNRERSQWFADAVLEMEMAAACMDPEALRLYAEAVRTTVNFPRKRAFASVVPTNDDALAIIPAQVLMGFSGLYDYYLYTGDRELLDETYEAIRDYLLKWKVKKNGTVKYPFGGSWEWGDSTQWTDYPLILSLWYQTDMQVMERVAEVLDKEEDALLFHGRSEEIGRLLRTSFLTEEGYLSSPDAPYTDERVQALAILNGVFEEGEYDAPGRLFAAGYTDPYFGGTSCYPLMEYYVEKACFAAGFPDVALMRMKERYREMVEGENAKSTLWEYWNYQQGTSNHAWAGGPLVLMARELAGVKPVEPEYEVFEVKPVVPDQMEGFSSFSVHVPTPKGDIVVEWKDGETEPLTVIEPPGTRAVMTE